MRHRESKVLDSGRQQDANSFEEESGETSGGEAPTLKIPSNNVAALS